MDDTHIGVGLPGAMNAASHVRLLTSSLSFPVMLDTNSRKKLSNSFPSMNPFPGSIVNRCGIILGNQIACQ